MKSALDYRIQIGKTVQARKLHVQKSRLEKHELQFFVN